MAKKERFSQKKPPIFKIKWRKKHLGLENELDLPKTQKNTTIQEQP